MQNRSGFGLLVMLFFMVLMTSDPWTDIFSSTFLQSNNLEKPATSGIDVWFAWDRCGICHNHGELTFHHRMSGRMSVGDFSAGRL